MEMGELVSRETGLSIAGMTLELFDREVNIADHESLNGFLLRYFGEVGRVTRILKGLFLFMCVVLPLCSPLIFPIPFPIPNSM